MDVRSLFRENLLLEVLDKDEDIYYKSIIQEVSKDYIVIGVPMRKQKQLYMAKNSRWDFRLVLKDTLYYFQSRSLGQKKGDQISLYMIAWPDEVRKVQRREFFRFPCSFDAHYWILKKPWDEKEKDAPIQPEVKDDETEDPMESINLKHKSIPLQTLAKMMGDPGEGIITDISGGGVQLVVPQWLPLGTTVLMGLFLKSKKENKDIYVKGKVVWVGPFQPEKTVRFRHAVEFEEIPVRDKEQIVRFIFILMRERMV